MIDALERELDRFAALGHSATFWLRDDDASTRTSALCTLLSVAHEFAVPLAVAAVPASADSTLVSALRGDGDVTIVQHGYAHGNHAGPGERSAELAPGRDLASTLADLERGRVDLEQMFGERFVPILVPPWNRVADAVLPRLAGIGFAGLSRFGPRPAALAAPALPQVNTHVDPIAWRRGRTFIGAASAIARIVEHLAARRERTSDPDEPTGLLTHHLAFGDDAWVFVQALFACTTRHPAARWLGVDDVFRAPAVTSARSA